MEYIQKMYNQTIEKHNAAIAAKKNATESQEIREVLEEAAKAAQVKQTRTSTRLSVATKRTTVTRQSTAAGTTAPKVSGQRKLTTISPFELQTEKRAKYSKDMDF